MVVFVFMLIIMNGILYDYIYDIIINDKKYKIENYVVFLFRFDKNKKMKCEYQ